MEDSANSKDAGLQRKSNEGGITGKGFKKGQSGNPSGKRKGTVSIAATLRNVLSQDQADQIVANLIELATNIPLRRQVYGCNCKMHGKDGDTYETYDGVEAKLHQWAVDTILERLDGKVTQPIGGDDNAPAIRFNIDPGKSLTGNATD